MSKPSESKTPASNQTSSTAKRLPKEKNPAETYLHWKHATFGKKREETKEDVEYKLRVNHIVDEHQLLSKHFEATDTFFRESNRIATQNEVLTQCMRDFVKEDEVHDYWYGASYERLQKAVSIDE